MNLTYLTTEELSTRMKYNARTIRNELKDSVLLEGRHYIRPFSWFSLCSADGKWRGLLWDTLG